MANVWDTAYRLVKGEKDKDIMRNVLLSERNYYKYKKKDINTFRRNTERKNR